MKIHRVVTTRNCESRQDLLLRQTEFPTISQMHVEGTCLSMHLLRGLRHVHCAYSSASFATN